MMLNQHCVSIEGDIIINVTCKVFVTFTDTKRQAAVCAVLLDDNNEPAEHGK